MAQSKKEFPKEDVERNFHTTWEQRRTDANEYLENQTIELDVDFEKNRININLPIHQLNLLLGEEEPTELSNIAETVGAILTQDWHGEEPKTPEARINEAINFMQMIAIQNAIRTLTKTNVKLPKE